MPLYIAYPPGRHVSLKLRAFIDWIIELIADQAPDIRPLR
jgi:DNA-binding transcriptional LysR family regulator